jgi:hypothetical protein
MHDREDNPHHTCGGGHPHPGITNPLFTGKDDMKIDIGHCEACFVENNRPRLSNGLDVFGLYHHYRNGMLLESGGIADQPAEYTDAMEVIESLNAHDIKMKQKKQEQELERQKKRGGYGR